MAPLLLMQNILEVAIWLDLCGTSWRRVNLLKHWLWNVLGYRKIPHLNLKVLIKTSAARKFSYKKFYYNIQFGRKRHPLPIVVAWKINITADLIAHMYYDLIYKYFFTTNLIFGYLHSRMIFVSTWPSHGTPFQLEVLLCWRTECLTWNIAAVLQIKLLALNLPSWI